MFYFCIGLNILSMCATINFNYLFKFKLKAEIFYPFIIYVLIYLLFSLAVVLLFLQKYVS